LLSACAAQPVVESRPPPPPQKKERPPANLMVVTPAPVFGGRTNADLLSYIDDWRSALGQCNANLDSIRTWADSLK
jgi:hypothetical protein